jgi:DNA-binding PadR family transcriptional regulator
VSAATFYILVALAQDDRHGYALIKEIQNFTAGEVALLPGTLYRLIGQLCRDRWIAEVRGAPSDDPRRRYYRLTPGGRKALAAEVTRLESMVKLVRKNRLLAGEA